MSNLGVFRDSFYNAVYALAATQAVAGPIVTGVIPASTLAGAQECYTSVGGNGATFTTDTAVNIIAQLQNAVAVAQKANVGGFASALGDTPPLGVPNLFNVSWYVNINLTGVTTGATLAQGTGVTITAMTGVGSGTALTPAMVNVGYVVTVTSATTVTFTRVV